MSVSLTSSEGRTVKPAPSWSLPFPALATLTLLAACVLPTFGQDPALEELKRRGQLGELAGYCRRELARPDLTRDRRVLVTVELAACLGRQAQMAPDLEGSDALWAEADRVLEKLLAETTPLPQRPQIARQRMVLSFSRGETRRLQAEITRSDVLLRQAQHHLQAAASQGEALHQDVLRQIEAFTPASAAGSTQLDELRRLAGELPYRLAEVSLRLALTHGENAQERAKLLNKAAQGFESYLGDGKREDEVAQRCRLGLAEVRRQARDWPRALAALAPLEQSNTLRDEALALHLHVLLDQNQPHQALALVEGRSRFSAELARARVRAMVLASALAHRQKDGTSALNYLQNALREVAVGEREFGPAWALRAAVPLIEHGEPSVPLDEPASVLRFAEALERAARWAGASLLFERAASLARISNDAQGSFALAVRGGRCRILAGQEAEAVHDLLRALPSAPDEARVAEVHSLVIDGLRRAWEKQPNERTRTALRHQIEEHLRRYGTDATRPQAHFTAALVARQDGAHREVITSLTNVPVNHRLHGEAVTLIVAAYLALRESVQTPAEADQVTREALNYLERQERGLGPDPANAMSRIGCKLGTTQVLLRPEATAADVQQALDSARYVRLHPDASGQQRELAEVCEVTAATVLGRKPELAIERLTLQQCQTLRRIIAPWSQVGSTEQRQRVALLQLHAAERLASEVPDLPPAHHKELALEAAWSRVHLRRDAEARASFKKLQETWPRDAQVLEQHAHALERLGTREDLAQAVDLWRSLTLVCREGTSSWFEAKLHLATCLRRSGEVERARKVLQATTAAWLSQPDAQLTPVQKDFKQRFAELERQWR